ncbi:MAG: hypothetical protein DSZ28_04645 [Thiothrix sp.]|nr:MAG: hypothetical protein DSZ28_04645 [Thiothrix sp.]
MLKFTVLHWTWCFPQSLLGIMLLSLLRLFSNVEIVRHAACGVIIAESDRMFGGISLGKYVFVARRGCSSQQRVRLIQHELGHARQSILLGPAYLLVIGIPSVIWATLRSAGFFKQRPYSWMYTEKWADRLAEGIDIADV